MNATWKWNDLSTRDEVTELSGRGVGLYAAREAVRELQGDMNVVFTGPADAQGFRPSFSLS